MLEIFQSVKVISRRQCPIDPPLRCDSAVEESMFHFAHGDLSYENMLVDADSGAIVGVLDWESAGFYPPWLACRNMTYLNDDGRRCILDEGQDELGVDNDDETETIERAQYLSRLKDASPEMYYHDRVDSETRMFFHHLSHRFESPSLLWLIKYRTIVWDADKKRDPFPLENMTEWTEALDLGVCNLFTCVCTSALITLLLPLQYFYYPKGHPNYFDLWWE